MQIRVGEFAGWRQSALLASGNVRKMRSVLRSQTISTALESSTLWGLLNICCEGRQATRCLRVREAGRGGEGREASHYRTHQTLRPTRAPRQGPSASPCEPALGRPGQRRCPRDSRGSQHAFPLPGRALWAHIFCLSTGDQAS